MWNSANDGAGSGLDADVLDGYHGSNFLGKNGSSYYQANNWIDMGPSNGCGLYWSSGNGTNWHLYPVDSSYMRMRSGNSSQTGIRFSTNGTDRNWLYCDSSNQIGFLNTSGSWAWRVDNSGNGTASGNVTAYSDITLKENIEVIPNALDKVSEIRGVTYNRKDMENNPRHAGVIAQEVELVLPEVVSTNEDGIKSVAYGNLVGLLIEAVKELKVEVETLKAERN